MNLRSDLQQSLGLRCIFPSLESSDNHIAIGRCMLEGGKADEGQILYENSIEDIVASHRNFEELNGPYLLKVSLLFI